MHLVQSRTARNFTSAAQFHTARQQPALAASGSEPLLRNARLGARRRRPAPRQRPARGRRPLIEGAAPSCRWTASGGSATSARRRAHRRQADPRRRAQPVGSGNAEVIDARGRIVMPGFIDTHHHQFETALRSFLADSILIDDGSGTPSARHRLLRNTSPAGSRVRAACYRPQDVYISELFGGLRSSTTASPPCTTSRRSTTRRSIRTPAVRRPDRLRAARRVRLLRERRRRGRQPVP